MGCGILLLVAEIRASGSDGTCRKTDRTIRADLALQSVSSYGVFYVSLTVLAFVLSSTLGSVYSAVDTSVHVVEKMAICDQSTHISAA